MDYREKVLNHKQHTTALVREFHTDMTLRIERIAEDLLNFHTEGIELVNAFDEMNPSPEADQLLRQVVRLSNRAFHTYEDFDEYEFPDLNLGDHRPDSDEEE